MAMNTREKIIATGIGVIGTLFVGQYVINSTLDGFEKKKTEIASLRTKEGDQKLLITAGEVAIKKLNTIVPKSLPHSTELAVADYLKWLTELAGEADLTAPNQNFGGDSEEKDKAFHKFNFKLEGTGTLANAVQLLYGFYAKDYLHRITRFQLTPIPNSNIPNQLTISLECEALALGIAKEKQEPPKGISNRLAKSLDEYKSVILGRNLFAPRNQAPKLDAKKTVEAKIGSPLEYAVEAKDIDPNQSVFYKLLSENNDIPKGMLIDQNSGKMSFRSNEVGEYQVRVQATDNGIPSKSSEQLVTIKVTPSPPVAAPPVQFDVASQAMVTALVAGRSGRQAWILSKTESKTYLLQKGDQLKLGGVTGLVKEVGANYVELETDGRKWIVGMDETLAEAFSRSKSD